MEEPWNQSDQDLPRGLRSKFAGVGGDCQGRLGQGCQGSGAIALKRSSGPLTLMRLCSSGRMEHGGQELSRCAGTACKL